jgi:hypothetical protein
MLSTSIHSTQILDESRATARRLRPRTAGDVSRANTSMTRRRSLDDAPSANASGDVDTQRVARCDDHAKLRYVAELRRAKQQQILDVAGGPGDR